LIFSEYLLLTGSIIEQGGLRVMEMRDFILHRDILSVEVKIDGSDYRFGMRWKAPEKPYGDTWILQSYANKLTGEKDLSKEQIEEFLDTINARWNWNMDDCKK
jgi:hypothetical protein